MNRSDSKKIIASVLVLVIGIVLIIMVLAGKRSRTAMIPTNETLGTEEQMTNLEQDGWTTYKNANPEFAIMHPAGFTVNSAYSYDALGPGKNIPGIAFVVSDEFTKGTNLSKDTSLSVEFPVQTDVCEPKSYLSSAMDEQIVVEDGKTWHVVTGADTAVGNHYEERLYVSDDCSIIVRYYVHSTSLAAYDPGTITAFDADGLQDVFDQMRATLDVK